MNEEIEALIQAAVKPYESIITELESQQKLKDAEIITLKYAVLEMHKKIEEL